jgi:hypothetical protein
MKAVSAQTKASTAAASCVSLFPREQRRLLFVQLHDKLPAHHFRLGFCYMDASIFKIQRRSFSL